MTNFYIAAAWVITLGVVGGYALTLAIRGRRLSRLVPAERRRWMADASRDVDADTADATTADFGSVDNIGQSATRSHAAHGGAGGASHV